LKIWGIFLFINNSWAWSGPVDSAEGHSFLLHQLVDTLDKIIARTGLVSTSFSFLVCSSPL